MNVFSLGTSVSDPDSIGSADPCRPKLSPKNEKMQKCQLWRAWTFFGHIWRFFHKNAMLWIRIQIWLQTDLGFRKVPGPVSGFSKSTSKTLFQKGYNKFRHRKRSVSKEKYGSWKLSGSTLNVVPYRYRTHSNNEIRQLPVVCPRNDEREKNW